VALLGLGEVGKHRGSFSSSGLSWRSIIIIEHVVGDTHDKSTAGVYPW